jgi:hypothetical protein
MIVNRVLEHWTSLTPYFREAYEEPDAADTTKSVNQINPIFQMYLFFLSFILGLVTKIKKIFQSEDPKVPLIIEEINFLYKSVLKCYLKRERKEGEKVIPLPLHEIKVSNPANYLPLDKVYYGAKADALQKHEMNNISMVDLHNFRLRCLALKANKGQI